MWAVRAYEELDRRRTCGSTEPSRHRRHPAALAPACVPHRSLPALTPTARIESLPPFATRGALPVSASQRKACRRAAERLQKSWQTACRKSHVVGMLRHDFRQTAVRNRLTRACRNVAQTMTGHKTRSVFDRYHIVSPADLQAAAQKLGDNNGDNGPSTIADPHGLCNNPSKRP